MNALDNILVTHLDCPVVVSSKRGDDFQMTDRPSYGLSFCISGQITYTMNGKSYVSTENTAILLPKGATYTLSRDKDGLFPLINFDCQNYINNEILLINLQNPKACINNFETLQKMFLNNKSQLKILSTFYELLNTVCEQVSFDSPLMKSAVQFIYENISNHDFSNKTIADKLNISEVYLRKLFNKHYNITPKQYLLEKRMQKAMYMLINSPLNITSISQECGFSNPYHFCRAFKQRTGYTPTQYIERNTVYKI